MQSWLEFLPCGIDLIMAIGSSKVEMSRTEASGVAPVTKKRHPDISDFAETGKSIDHSKRSRGVRKYRHNEVKMAMFVSTIM